MMKFRHQVLHMPLVIMLVCGTMAMPVRAQFGQQGSKLVGTGALGGAQQGTAISLSSDGNTAVVGGSSDNGGAGAAWVYTCSRGVWSQQAKLVGIDAARPSNEEQGFSVSLSADGNTAIVGAPGGNLNVGAAWVYTRSDGVWTQHGPKLVGTGALGDAKQGISVSLSGDGNTAIVGGTFDDGALGAAWVFTRSNGVWGQLQAKLVGAGAIGNALQGYSVSLSDDGNYVMLGGPSDNRDIVSGQAVGAGWVFVKFPKAPGTATCVAQSIVNSRSSVIATTSPQQQP